MGLGKINQLKKELKLTNAQLSELSGVPLGTLDKITSGTTTDPKLETVKAIAKALNCTLDDLGDMQSNNDKITTQEIHHIKKYRQLDDISKEIVDFIIDKETIRNADTPKVYKLAGRNGPKEIDEQTGKDIAQKALKAKDNPIPDDLV